MHRIWLAQGEGGDLDVEAVAAALKKISGVHAVGANLETGTIFVCADSRVTFTDPQLKELFLDKGFTYRSFEQAAECSMYIDDYDVDATSDVADDHADHPATDS